MDLLVAHSFLRWLVLLAAVAALAVAVAGCLGLGTSERLARQSMLGFVVLLDLQVLFGILVWVSGNYMAGGGRRAQIEHPAVMLLALVVTHVAAARARRAPSPFGAARVRALGIGLSLVLILMGILLVTMDHVAQTAS